MYRSIVILQQEAEDEKGKLLIKGSEEIGCVHRSMMSDFVFFLLIVRKRHKVMASSAKSALKHP